MTTDRSSDARARLAAPAYAPVWAGARKRLEGNGRSLGGSALVLGGLDAAERTAVCGLLGRSPAGDGPVRVRLADLDDALRRGAASVGLIELLEAMGGPVRDRRAERAVAAVTKAEAWAAPESHPVLADRPELVAWTAEIRRRGTATRLAGSAPAGAALTGAALDVLGRLPAANQALSVLAAETGGGAHALDRGQPLGTLVAAALVVLDVEEEEDDVGGDWAGASAYWWRRRWARVGVVCDDLSVSALVLNLPVEPGGDIIAEAAYEHAMANEPLRLTLRQLALGDWSFRRGAVVYVCENPTVLAQAAVLLEDGCAPLVCVEGQPNTAAHEVLAMLAAAGADLRYHGDFDWGGLRIATTVMTRHRAQPWRFTTADYLAAAPASGLELGPPPAGAVAAWDPGLVEAMATTDRVVEEEQILDTLLTDLDQGQAAGVGEPIVCPAWPPVASNGP